MAMEDKASQNQPCCNNIAQFLVLCLHVSMRETHTQRERQNLFFFLIILKTKIESKHFAFRRTLSRNTTLVACPRVLLFVRV